MAIRPLTRISIRHLFAAWAAILLAGSVQALRVLRPADVAWLPGDAGPMLPWLLGWPAVGLAMTMMFLVSRRLGWAAAWMVGAAWALPTAVVLTPWLAPLLGELLSDDELAAWIITLCAFSIVLLKERAAWIGVVALLLGTALETSTVRLAEQGPGGASGASIVLITLDTFRADHLGILGGPVSTPNLDALAVRGRFFSEGVAPAPVTGPAHAGMLTGQPPHELPVMKNGDVLPMEVETVATRLRAEGYRTGAFVSSSVLDRKVELSRGFEHYDDRLCPFSRLSKHTPWTFVRSLGARLPRCTQRPGESTVARAQQWLASVDGPVFLWVHLYDAHGPRDLVKEPEAPHFTSASWKGWRSEHYPSMSLMFNRRPQRNIRHQRAAYAAEVAHVDRVVGRLVEAMPSDTQWVIASDHGESLGEHEYDMNHGRHVFQATLRVPLWVVAEGIEPERVDVPTPSFLVGETIAGLAGLPADASLLNREPWSQPIVSFTTGQEAMPLFSLGPKGPELGLRSGPSKIVARKTTMWSFDLNEDAHERHPNVVDHPQARTLLENLTEDASGTHTEEVEWLEELGYVE